MPGNHSAQGIFFGMPGTVDFLDCHEDFAECKPMRVCPHNSDSNLQGGVEEKILLIRDNFFAFVSTFVISTPACRSPKTCSATGRTVVKTLHMKTLRKKSKPKLEKAHIRMSVNGEDVEVAFAPHKTLLEVLREDLRLTGTKHGCELGECGCCAVLVDGQPVLSCLA